MSDIVKWLKAIILDTKGIEIPWDACVQVPVRREDVENILHEILCLRNQNRRKDQIIEDMKAKLKNVKLTHEEWSRIYWTDR